MKLNTVLIATLAASVIAVPVFAAGSNGVPTPSASAKPAATMPGSAEAGTQPAKKHHKKFHHQKKQAASPTTSSN
jgi:hypothetical protein